VLKTLLLNIFVETLTNRTFKEQHLFKTYLFLHYVFPVIFDQFNASSLKKSIDFFLSKNKNKNTDPNV